MIDTALTHLILIAVCFIFLFPCLWLILASFSKSGSIYSFKGFFPQEYSLDTFRNLFTDTEMYNYPQWFRNTLFIAVMSCLLGSFLVILTAYTMSRFQFGGRKMIMKTTLVLGMFPSFMGMIAVYIIMTQFGLINKMWGLILIYSANAPMGYLTQKGFFDTIPISIDEAARIDGASAPTIFRKITLPYMLFVMTPNLITSFTGNINNFNVIFLLSGGGPDSLDYYYAGKTDLLVTWLYRLTITQKDYNLGAVIGILVFIILATVSLLTYRRTGSYKDEGAFQ